MLHLLAAACLSAATASPLDGTWWLPIGVVQIADGAEGVVGTLVKPSGECAALAAGSEVLHGAVQEGTFSGEVRLCLEGPQCTTKETFLSALLMANPKGDQLSGAVERGNDACHAKLSSKGGLLIKKFTPGAKVAPKPTAKPKAASPKEAAARALISEGGDLLGAGNPEAARKKFEASVGVEPLPEAYNGIGVTHRMRNEPQEAMAAYHQAIELDPDFGDAYYNIACIYALGGKTDAAFKFLHLSVKNQYHLDELDDDADLSSLRADPRYAELKKAMAANAAKQP